MTLTYNRRSLLENLRKFILPVCHQLNIRTAIRERATEDPLEVLTYLKAASTFFPSCTDLPLANAYLPSKLIAHNNLDCHLSRNRR